MINFRKTRYAPKSFQEFIGQIEAVNISRTIQKRIQRNLYPTNFICYGGYGLGKTQYVEVLANALNAKLIKYVGNEIDKKNLPEIINEINDSIEEVVILFVDEIDTANWKVLKELNVVVESFNYKNKQVKPFMFCGASINKGRVAKRNPDLLNRFQFSILFKPYSIKELCVILTQYSREMFPCEEIPSNIIQQIALNSKQNLRNCLTMIENYVCERDLDYLLKNNQIVHKGITEKDIEILLCLYNTTKPVGTNYISAQCNMGEEDYLFDYENYLLAKSFIQRSPRRSITPKGINLLIKLGYIKDNQVRRDHQENILTVQGPIAQPKQYELNNKTINSFVESLDVCQNTKNVYLRALKEWIKFKEINKGPLDRNLILKYKTNLINKELSPYTISLYMTTVKLYFDYLIEIGALMKNPVKKIKRIKRPKSKREALQKQEAKALLGLELNDSLEDKRNKAVLHLKMLTGLRDISIVNLNIEDLQQTNGKHTLFYLTKGSTTKDNFVILNDKLYQIIDNYIREGKRQGNDPLFVSHSPRNADQRLTTQSIRLVINKLFKKCGIDRSGITPHSLRHTAITYALESGCSIPQVRDMASHKSVEVTMGYYNNLERFNKPAEGFIDSYLEY